MSRFLVAGFIQIETIVKVDKLPVPYSLQAIFTTDSALYMTMVRTV